MGDDADKPTARDPKSLLKEYMPWVLAILGLLQLLGWIPQPVADKIRETLPLIVAASPSDNQSTVAADEKPAGNEIKATESAAVLSPGQVVEFSFFDHETCNPVTIRITCGEGPRPPPEPTLASVFGLSTVSRDGMRRVVSEKRSEQAARIAAIHRRAADNAHGQPFGLIESMQHEVRSGIADALTPEQRAAWKPWADDVAARVAILQTENRLSDRSQWIDAFREIANGLETP